MNNIAETERLIISRFTEEDAEFVYNLMNSPGWLKFIGDRNITDKNAALKYLGNNALRSYADNGYGGWVLTEKSTGKKVGSAGIHKRDFLEHPDLGYALLPEYEGLGYASEAAEKVIEIASSVYQLPVLTAITTKDNRRSIALLEKFGFQLKGEMTWPETEEILIIFAREA